MAQRLPGFCGTGIAVDKQFSFKTNKLSIYKGKKNATIHASGNPAKPTNKQKIRVKN